MRDSKFIYRINLSYSLEEFKYHVLGLDIKEVENVVIRGVSKFLDES